MSGLYINELPTVFCMGITNRGVKSEKGDEWINNDITGQENTLVATFVHCSPAVCSLRR
jgi:hypothetical protein